MTAHLFKLVCLRDDVTGSGLACGEGTANNLPLPQGSQRLKPVRSYPLGAFKRHACASRAWSRHGQRERHCSFARTCDKSEG